MEADCDESAVALAVKALDQCDWADTYQVQPEGHVHGLDVALLVDSCASDQVRRLHDFALACHPDPLIYLAETHDPRLTWDDGGVQVLLLSAMADVIAGLWTPWSAGYDVTAVRSDFADVIARLDERPDAQWAIPVVIEVAS